MKLTTTATIRVALNASINEPGRRRIETAELALSLRNGEPANPSDELANAIAKMFERCAPELVVLAAVESGGSVSSAWALYQATLELGHPRVPSWDRTND